MNFHNLAKRALTGAAIGGAVGFALVCLIIYLIFKDSLLLADSLLIFGIGGLVGGALYGLFLGLVDNRAAVVIGGLVGGIVGCALMGFGLSMHLGTPQPSPQPYPGFEVYTSSGSGSQASNRVQTYTAAFSMDTMQKYYGEELDKYCADDWEFLDFMNTEDQLCLFADCRIPRLRYQQFFEVNLCSISETQTLIHHIDIWDSH